MLYQTFIYPIELIIEFTFTLFHKILGNNGLAILGVSVAVTMLALPLYVLAERWQDKERKAIQKLAPKVKKIKKTFSGDEQYMILSTYYKQNHYHPVYALRSSFSILIQVPFFIAAFHFLSHLTSLQGQSFLFIQDLGAADALFKIGSFSINILPITMTIINIISGIIYTRGHPIQEKIQINVMAALFLVLLYTSPAGLVLYWTMNNIFSLVKNVFYKLKHPIKVLYVIAATAAAILGFYVLFFSGFTKAKTFLLLCFSLFIIFIWVWVLLGKWLVNKPLIKLNSHPKDRTKIFILSTIALALLTGLVIPSSLVVTSPSEFANLTPFASPLSLIANPLEQAIGIFVFWSIAIYFLFPDKIKTLLCYIYSIFIITAVINVFIKTGDYGLISFNLQFSRGLEKVPTLSILLGDVLITITVAIVLLFVFKYIKYSIVHSLVAISSFVFLSMGIYNDVKIAHNYKEYTIELAANDKSFTKTKDTPLYHLSKTGKNVVVFMLDRAINDYVEPIMNELPKTAKQFDGFTRYANSVSFEQMTLIGSPPLYGGWEYSPDNMNKRSDMANVDKHNEALKVMPVLFSNAGFKATVTDPSWANYNWVPDTRIYKEYPEITVTNVEGKFTDRWETEHNYSHILQGTLLKRNFILFSLFRILPATLRGGLYNDGIWWNPSYPRTKNDDFINSYSSLYYLSALTDTDSSNPGFSLIVNNATHDPAFLQHPEYVPVNKITNSGTKTFPSERERLHYDANAGVLIQLGNWFDYLRQNDVWNNTKIILVSDHGYALNLPAFESFAGDKQRAAWHNCFLMVKDFNAENAIHTDYTLMSNADTPYLATKDVINNPTNPFTSNAITQHDKSEGITIYSNSRFAPEYHPKNTFNLKSKQIIKDSIFDASNWSTINDNN
ncbi:MAG: hypothetical protein BKP49_11105 [Treponema sp. CETP13]|nr:MAG: hypothetical protein BKP49_11105 [Treponema sp. CETP13]